MEIFIRSITLMFIGAVKLYQAVVSPLMPQTCRHLPTCSEYTIEALKVFGPFKGTYLGIKRIINCIALTALSFSMIWSDRTIV